MTISANDFPLGPIYREGPITAADYDDAIADLQRAKAQCLKIETEGYQACAICEDDHHAGLCHHNPLVMARRAAEEVGKFRCYHCGFVATDDVAAKKHFGETDQVTVACLRGEKWSPAEVFAHRVLNARSLKSEAGRLAMYVVALSVTARELTLRIARAEEA